MEDLFEDSEESPISAALNSPAPSYPQLEITDNETTEILGVCREFKQSVINSASAKKDNLQTAMSYLKGKFVGGDLLPIPSTSGNEKDLNKSRPQIFIPVTRQQVKTIYSQLKMILFPNDEDYFRVRAKTAEGVEFEDTLTNGLKFIFKENDIPQKLAQEIYNVIWAGFFACFPTAQFDKAQEWQIVQGQPVIDPETGVQLLDPITEEGQFYPDSYEEVIRDLPPKLTIDSFNPLNFYIDPTERDPERLKWVYCCDKKFIDIMDSPYYINKDELENYVKESKENTGNDRKDTSNATDLNDTYTDKPGFIKYDFYYFPYLQLKESGRSFRNVFVGVAAENLLIRFHPNMLPGGLNPAVFQNWSASVPDDAYSQGVVEDLINLQKMINILYNYKMEQMARSGNRFAIRPNVDMTNFFGVAGGVMVTENPREDVVNVSADYSEMAALDNTIGVLKAEAQLLSGAQNPFQGASQIDYKKTATELQILQEGSISILREVATNVSIGIKRVLERLMYIVADIYTEPVMIPNEDALGQKQFIPVQFAMLKSGQFNIDIISANPAQSKQAQVNSLKELLTFIVEQPPEVVEIVKPLLEKIGTLNGILDIGVQLDKMKERLDYARQQAIQQQAGMGAGQQPPIQGADASVVAG